MTRTQNKDMARKKYAERQIKKWVNWSWEKRGFIKWKELVKLQDDHNIEIL